MQRQIKFSVGEYYHVYNRGVEKRKIFINDNDRSRFHKLLYLANSNNSFELRKIKETDIYKIERGKPLVSIGGYVLMSNHFHILVKEISNNGLSKFMEKLTTGYSMYFNKKYERVGPLFQGRFKGEHVDNDEYLKYLYAYVHLNPVKLIEPDWKEDGIKNKGRVLKFINQYYYSSYIDYCGIKRREGVIISENEFPDYFLNTDRFRASMNDWLGYRKQL